MIKVVMGLKGMGKTKTLIDNVNNSVNEEHGNVICIEKNQKLRYDISYKARLISAKEYEIDSFDKFYGFICGLIAGNYDITSVYVDSILKICGEDMNEFYNFLKKIEKLTENIKFYMTASYDIEKVPENLREYIHCHE